MPFVKDPVPSPEPARDPPLASCSALNPELPRRPPPRRLLNPDVRPLPPVSPRPSVPLARLLVIPPPVSPRLSAPPAKLLAIPPPPPILLAIPPPPPPKLRP